ncbi:unnamed protein product, partial [Musa textilis]
PGPPPAGGADRDCARRGRPLADRRRGRGRSRPWCSGDSAQKGNNKRLKKKESKRKQA